jgi:hypothetical protein
MAQISLPSANIPIGTAKINVNGEEQEVKITLSPDWYRQLLLLVKQLNQNTTDLNP